MTLSSWATTSLEEVSKSSPGLKWFQLYVYKNRSISEDFVKRAEKHGFKALVLTVDTPVLGQRYADARNKFKLPPHLNLENHKKQYFKVESLHGSGLASLVNSLVDPSLTWETISWLRSVTDLPIIVKGVITKEDAELAVQHGVDGIWVSNHGARQLDTVPTTVSKMSPYSFVYLKFLGYEIGFSPSVSEGY